MLINVSGNETQVSETKCAETCWSNYPAKQSDAGLMKLRAEGHKQCPLKLILWGQQYPESAFSPENRRQQWNKPTEES